MTTGDTASRLAHATDVVRGESRWLTEQAARVAEGMDMAWPIMREARERIRDLESALRPFAGLPETSEAETAVPNNSPVTIRCELGDVRRAQAALNPTK
jgi:hypothetical protein